MTQTQTPTEYLQTPVGELPVRMRNLSAEIEVPSSTPGQSYTVTVTRSFVSCTCKGYHFHGACKHATMITAVLTKGV